MVTELCLLFVLVVLCLFDVQHVMMVHGLLSLSGSLAMKCVIFLRCDFRSGDAYL